MIVSSVAPPTKRSRCERTVTRAFTFAPMPSLATPSMVDNHANRDATQAHSDHFADGDGRIGDPRTQPETEKIEENNNKNEGNDGDDGEADEIKGFHGGQLIR